MATWKAILSIATVMIGPLAASAEERVLVLEPQRTRVTFTVKATGHDVDGVLALDSGQIRFDPDTGAVSGQVTLDLRRAQTGNRLRDREMRQSVFEAERFPLVVFRPSRMEGALQPSAVSEIVLVGIVLMHGSEHAFSLPVKVRQEGEKISAEAIFDIPYVAWGMWNPSVLFLRVAPAAVVTVRTEATLLVDGGAR
jgi:polyisoprenoid-binding protein YceI